MTGYITYMDRFSELWIGFLVYGSALGFMDRLSGGHALGANWAHAHAHDRSHGPTWDRGTVRPRGPYGPEGALEGAGPWGRTGGAPPSQRPPPPLLFLPPTLLLLPLLLLLLTPCIHFTFHKQVIVLACIESKNTLMRYA